MHNIRWRVAVNRELLVVDAVVGAVEVMVETEVVSVTRLVWPPKATVQGPVHGRTQVWHAQFYDSVDGD